MTREEAIKILSLYDVNGGWCDTNGRDVPAEIQVEAFAMAIKALQAEAVQIPIKLEKRYPESKDEDITDVFMRGYLAGRSSAEAVQGWIPFTRRPMTEEEQEDRLEIVRCKDCRFWKNEHLCLVMSRYGTMETKAEHYCSWGERREP